MTAPPASAKALRQKRLAEALRANLKRRKASATGGRRPGRPADTGTKRGDDAPGRP